MYADKRLRVLRLTALHEPPAVKVESCRPQLRLVLGTGIGSDSLGQYIGGSGFGG
jgi:hypothetical protein